MNAFTKSLPIVCAALVASSAFAAKPDTDGARIGVWTQDYDAAVALAKTNNLPLMLNFTGSDWCGWCKLMHRQVFSQEEWKAWAATNLVLVTIDFPSDESLVPEAYRDRNLKLQEQYGVQGYPTYVLLTPAGEEFARLGASRDATPASFIAEVKAALAENDPAVRAAKLTPEELAEWDEIEAKNKAVEARAREARDAIEAKIAEWERKLDDAKASDPSSVAALQSKALDEISALQKAQRKEMEGEAEGFRARRRRLEELRAKLAK